MSGPFPVSIPPYPGLSYLGSAQIASLVAAVGLPTVPTGASIASLSIEGGNARWGVVGALPTGSTGTPLWGTVGGIMVARTMFATIRFIDMTGSTSKINVDWYGG